MKVQELQERLARGEPTTVVDIRPKEQREEWSIPGSIWAPAYDSLAKDEPGPLASLELPQDQVVVTVCARGVTAQKATKVLQARHPKVHTLEGGMNAWNQAYNLAETRLHGGTRLVQVRRTGKGCLSHVLENQGEALIVDAGLDLEAYLQVARQLDAKVIGVLDTHVHADHLSRNPPLARRLGVPYYIGRSQKLKTDYTGLSDGDQIDFGDDHLTVLHTPGHTWEHSTYQVADALLTGDTLFTDGVGRPDLGAGRTETRDRAYALHESLGRLLDHPDTHRVLPAHASQPLPFDNIQWSATLSEIQDRVSWLSLGPEEFVDKIISHLGDVPPAYHRIVELNLAGEWDPDEADSLEAGPNRCTSGA